MSISTIPNPKYVLCKECVFNKKVKVMKTGKTRMVPHCTRTRPYRQLRGQKGCDKGLAFDYAVGQVLLDAQERRDPPR
jgi:hypothetical protein